MARNIIDIGVEGNDGTGDSIRESFRKTNENFRELYAVFGQGGEISITNLDDTPDSLTVTDANKILAINTSGSAVNFKTLVGGEGISVTSDNDQVVITNTGANLKDDQTPELAYHLNVNNQMIGYIKNPTNPLDIQQFNTIYGTNLNTDGRDFAITKGFADARYVNISGDLMTGHLSVPAGAAGSQVPRASEVVLKTGGQMSGKLYLSDHPYPLEGAGTPTDANDLQAATKYYVDNSNYNSTTNLYVSTNGSDEQTYTPVGQEGRSWSYAFKSINRACQYATELMEKAPWEPGPYRQLISYNNGQTYSEVTGTTTNSNGTLRVFFKNNGGLRVDQGNAANIDLISGKIVLGRTSGAKGFIYQYYGPTTLPNQPSNSDYFDLEDVEGTFIDGENLEFAEPVKFEQITIYVESGIYYEDYPIKLAQNVSIVGDEFRRTIVRPADRPSRSPWATTWFRRDQTFDGMKIAETEYGYHYLTDPSDRLSEPKNNRDIDVFLCNDAVIVRQISVQGHGGFYMVLDPEGQVLSKSPYCQQGSSFARSENRQAFRGGQFVDGFTGNLTVKVDTKESNLEVTVTDAERAPNTPCSFVVNGETYQVDAFTDDGNGDGAARRLILKNKEFIKAEVIGYINTELTPEFVFDRTKCARDISYIVDALAYDLIFNSNYRSIKAGTAYYRGAQYNVFGEQVTQTVTALTYAGQLISDILSNNVAAQTAVANNLATIIDIITNGVPVSIDWNIPNSPNTSTNAANARDAIDANLGFLKAEVIAYLDTVFNDIDYPEFTYNADKCRRDVEYLLEAVNYDIIYGGNSQTVDAGKLYYDGIGTLLIPNQTLQTTEAINYLKTLLASVLRNVSISVQDLYQTAVSQSPVTPVDLNTVTNVQSLLVTINNIILGGPGSAPSIVEPTTSGIASDLIDSRNLLLNGTPGIQSDTLAYLEGTYSYNQTICARDTGYIVEAIAHDIYYSGNLRTIQAALAYFKGSASAKIVLDSQLENTLAAIDYIETVILEIIGNNPLSVRYQDTFVQFIDESLVSNGATPTRIGELFDELTTIIGGSTGRDDARALLVANKDFIKAEVIAWIAETYPGFSYNEEICSRDVGFIIANLSSDLLYGGHYNTVRSALRYYAGSAALVIASQKTQTIAALNYAKTLAANVLAQTDPTVVRSTVTQFKDPSLDGTNAITAMNNLFTTLTSVINNPASAPTSGVFEYPIYKLILNPNTAFSGAYPSEIMLLTAGNTSMCSNDFTQVNDLGYGLVATNSGLIETVSVFTYYCWTGMYSCNGGQIRSLNGSNAHGTYGIVAEGSNPLEVPDEVSLLMNQVQVAKVYKRNAYAASGNKDAFDFYIDGFEYLPFDAGTIEIDHGPTIGIKKYSLASVSDGSADSGEVPTPDTGTIVRVQLTVSSIVGITNGLAADLTDGQLVTVYVGQQQGWYNVRETQPTRPSTALTYLGDAADDENKPVYRVISYSTLDSLGISFQSARTITDITTTNPVTATTTTNHDFSSGDRIVFSSVKGMLEINNNVYFAKPDPTDLTKFSVYQDKALTIPLNGTTFGAYIDDPEGLNVVVKNGDYSILETDEPYDYIQLDVNQTYVGNADSLNPGKTLGATAGDVRIAVDEVSSELVKARLQTGQMLFAWSGKVHRISAFNEELGYAIITIADTDSQGNPLQNLNTPAGAGGLYASVDPDTNPNLLPNSSPFFTVVLQKNEPANITVKISTCRATGHDFLDIGTGGYNTSNYPNKIYGEPVEAPKPDQQTDERTRGRTFFVSTDQDGFFRVGRFFSVDQGTGEVGFDVGRLSLEGVTGLKFRKGVRVTEFSPDSNFTLANDFKVPTQAAVQNYIDRRLGLTRTNSTPTQTIGAGFLDRAGNNDATGDISLGGNKLLNVGSPVSDSDGVNKLYVRSQELSDDRVDTTTGTAKAANDLLVYNGTKWVNAETATTGNIQTSLSSKNLALNIKSETITNSHISTSAAIEQSKLSMNAATTRANATGISQADLGLSSFNSNQFTTTNGWVELKTSTTGGVTGVTLDKIQYIGGNAILGRRDGISGPPTELSASNIVTDGDGIKNASFTSSGAMTVTTSVGNPNAYSVTGISTDGTGNCLVKTDANGAIDVQKLKIDSYTILDTSTTTLEVYTPGGVKAISATGNTNATATMSIIAGNGLAITGDTTITGDIATSGTGSNISAVNDVSAGNEVSAPYGSFTTSITTPLLTTGDSATAGVVTGNWTLSSGSKFQATYADLAEYYQGDREYGVGTVLIFGGDNEVTVTNIFGDRRVAGVVSENAAYIMNAECPGTKVCVALQGRVPVRVVGKVTKGDLLVTSAKPGFAIVNNDPKVGTVIGKALANKDDAGEGVIEVAVGRL